MTDENVTLLTQARTHLIRCLRRQLAAHDTWKSARDLASRFGGPFVRHERDANTELAAAKDSADLAETAYRRAERALCSWTILPLMLLALLFTSSAHAYHFAENADGHRARWATDEVVLHIDPQLVEMLGRRSITEAVQGAADQWSGIGGAPIIKVSPWPADPYSEFTDESSVVYGYGYPWHTELATTILRFGPHGEIRKATIALNPEYMDRLGLTEGGETPDPHLYDLQSVLTHETGHLMGLAHSSVDGSVMDTTLRAGHEQRVLGDDDEQGIAALYEAPRTGGCQAAGPDSGPKWWEIYISGIIFIWVLRRELHRSTDKNS